MKTVHAMVTWSMEFDDYCYFILFLWRAYYSSTDSVCIKCVGHNLKLRAVITRITDGTERHFWCQSWASHITEKMYKGMGVQRKMGINALHGISTMHEWERPWEEFEHKRKTEFTDNNLSYSHTQKRNVLPLFGIAYHVHRRYTDWSIQASIPVHIDYLKGLFKGINTYRSFRRKSFGERPALSRGIDVCPISAWKGAKRSSPHGPGRN